MTPKNKIKVPDAMGEYIEWYRIPESIQAGNAWLNRIGAEHVRFGSSEGYAVLRWTSNRKVFMRSGNVRSICLFLMISSWYRRLQLKRDWYMDEEMCLRMLHVDVIEKAVEGQIKPGINWNRIIDDIKRYNLKVYVGDADKCSDINDIQMITEALDKKALYFDNDYNNTKKIFNVILYVTGFFDNEHAKRFCDDFNRARIKVEWHGGTEPFVKIRREDGHAAKGVLH